MLSQRDFVLSLLLLSLFLTYKGEHNALTTITLSKRYRFVLGYVWYLLSCSMGWSWSKGSLSSV